MEGEDQIKDSKPSRGIRLLSLGFIALSLAATFALHFGAYGAPVLGFYLVTALLLVVGWWRTPQPKTSGHAFIGLGLLLFIPIFGLLLSAGLLAWSLWLPPPDEGQGEIGAADMVVFDIRNRLLRPGKAPTAEKFLPAVSLLQSSDIDERRAAIEVLAQIGGPEQIEHLQNCLDDPEREVYQYAHAKLSELHEKYTEAIKVAQNRSAEETLNGTLAYLHSGLLGEATEKFYRQKAISLVVELLKERADDPSLLSLLGELYLEEGSLQEAGVALGRGIALDPDSVEARWGLAKLAYRDHSYGIFLQHLASLRDLTAGRQGLDRSITEAVSWWFEGLEDDQHEAAR